MPFYDWVCPKGHEREVCCSIFRRDNPQTCECGEPMDRIIAAPHVPVDGVYSYAPNVGSRAHFERHDAERQSQAYAKKHRRRGSG